MTKLPRVLVASLVVLLGLVAGGCADDDDQPDSTAALEPDPTATAEPEPAATDVPEPAATDVPEPTATAVPEPTATTEPEPTATTEPEPTATPGLPGEPFDFLVPADGELIGVIGVAFDDILEVHTLPGENTPLVGELPNLADTVEGTGQGRQLPASIWWNVRYEGIEGWAGSGFLARIGDTFDITAQVVAANGDSQPQAETMLDLGMMVADLRASVEPQSRIVVSVAPSVSGDDFGEITIDVVGLGDDAVRGERLHIFGDGADMGGEGFALSNVEMTLLCARGVSEGICV